MLRCGPPFHLSAIRALISSKCTGGNHVYRRPNAEIPKEIEDVIGLDGGVETFEDRLIHFLDVLQRSITVAENLP
jgi:hypothetical protein